MFNVLITLKSCGGDLKRFALLTVCLTGLSTAFVSIGQYMQAHNHTVASGICSTAKFQN